MKEYVEKVIKAYPDMKFERRCLKTQMRSMGFTEEDVIYSMSFGHPDGERVQNSDLSDKTAKIAMVLKEKQREMNDEYFLYLLKRYQQLDEEIIFLEESIAELPDELADIMTALVIRGDSWEMVQKVFCVGKHKLFESRKEATRYLVRAYQRRESYASAYLLS